MLLNLIHHQPDIDEILLICQRCNNPKAFTEYSNDLDGIYENIEDYIRNKKRKLLTVFDDMIVMVSNKKLNPIVTELFTRSRKLNISLVFITQFYFAILKNIGLSSTHYFIMNILNKQELQQIAINHSF